MGKDIDQLIFTTIYHESRVILGISAEEYCIADCIYHLSNNPKSNNGWCYASRASISRWLDISVRTVFRALVKLEKLNIIERDKEDNNNMKTTSVWYETAVIRPRQNGTVYDKMARVPRQNGTGTATKWHTNIYKYNNNYIKDLKEKYRTLGNSDSEVRQKMQIEKEINRLQT